MLRHVCAAQAGTVVCYVASAGAYVKGGPPLVTDWERLAREARLTEPLAMAVSKGELSVSSVKSTQLKCVGLGWQRDLTREARRIEPRPWG
jgi:hypothetical protein